MEVYISGLFIGISLRFVFNFLAVCFRSSVSLLLIFWQSAFNLLSVCFGSSSSLLSIFCQIVFLLLLCIGLLCCFLRRRRYILQKTSLTQRYPQCHINGGGSDDGHNSIESGDADIPAQGDVSSRLA